MQESDEQESMSQAIASDARKEEVRQKKGSSHLKAYRVSNPLRM